MTLKPAFFSESRPFLPTGIVDTFFRPVRQQRVLGLIDARHDRTQHARELSGVRARRDRRFLRAAQPGRGDELHRASDLLGVLHRADAASEIEKRGHRYSLSAHPHFTAAATAVAKRSLKASTAVLISPLMASSRAFFAAIFFRIEG